MSGELDKLDKLLDHKNKRSKTIQTQWAKVTSVDWEEKTCEAEGVDDGLPFYDILLGIGSVYLKPKNESLVLIGLVNNDETTPFLISAEEVEEIVLKTNNCELNINDGFRLKKENETLKKLVVDILKFVKTAERKTSNGVTLGLINTQTAIADQLITRTENLLK